MRGMSFLLVRSKLSLAVSHDGGQKKAGMIEHREVIDHAGLLVNRPPGIAELSFS
jgi:hypothetical protein